MMLATTALGLASLLTLAAPQEERGVRQHEEGAFEGYTLLAPLRSSTTYLVDMNGETVHTWEGEHPPCSGVYLLDNGHLLRPVRLDSETFFAGGQGGRLVEHDWDGDIVWELEWSDSQTMQHHDLHPRANGNVLFIAWEHNSRADAIAWGRDPAQVDERGFWTGAVFEVEPVLPKGGRVVWEWHVRDHLIQDFDPDRENYGDVSAHPEKVDINADHRDSPPMSAMSAAERARIAELEEQMRQVGYVGDDENEEEVEDGVDEKIEADFLHLNAIDLHEGLDLIALSTPHLNEIWVIDRSTTTEEAAGHENGERGQGGDLLYRWGNPKTYGADSPRRFFYQHDVRWIPDDCPGAGNLLVFNNGGGRPDGDYSSVDELVLPWGSDVAFERTGDAFGPDDPQWSYTADEPESLFSGFISGAHRLPNGNTLICAGIDGRVLEVTRDGRTVWELHNPFAGSLAPMGKPPQSTLDAGDGPPPGAPSSMLRYGLFRATRLAPDHPGLARLKR
jgi:hypothetical protein